MREQTSGAYVCSKCWRGMMRPQTRTEWMTPPPVGTTSVFLGFHKCSWCGHERHVENFEPLRTQAEIMRDPVRPVRRGIVVGNPLVDIPGYPSKK